MTLADIQENALNLPLGDRAALAAELLSSIPPVLNDEDEGVAEAHRRSRELDEDPTSACSWEEIKDSLGR